MNTVENYRKELANRSESETHLTCGRCKERKQISEFTQSRIAHTRNPACKVCDKKSKRSSYVKNLKTYMLREARRRSEKQSIEFSITKEDIEFPDNCPLLNVPMYVNKDKMCDQSYTLDRIQPELGYVPGNVWVISNKANRIKNDASLQELELLTKNLKERVPYNRI